MHLESYAKCPKCGEEMYFVADTSACFTVTKDGQIGLAVIDQDTIDLMNESVFEDDSVEFHCRHCHSSFEACYNAHTNKYDIGNEI